MDVVPDSNVIISALCFPQSMGNEILQAAQERHFNLWIPEYIYLETQRVLQRDFPDHIKKVDNVLSQFHRAGELPDRELVVKCHSLIDDAKDAPVLASVLKTGPDIFITADIDDFHTEKMKSHLEENKIQLRTPFRFLKEIDRR